MPVHSSDSKADGCPACSVDAGRRDFVKHLAAAAIGALVAAGMPAALAAATTPESVISRRRVGANPSYPIPAQDGVQIDAKNEVILVRWKGSIYAFNLACPHQNVALRWNQGDGQFQCPKHHSKYQPDGTFITGRATRNMDRFSVTKTGNEVVVNVGAMHKNDVDATGWSAAAIPVSGTV